MGRPKTNFEKKIVFDPTFFRGNNNEIALIVGCNDQMLRIRFLKPLAKRRAEWRTWLREQQNAAAKKGDPTIRIRRAIDGCPLPFHPRITAGIKASPAMVEMRPGWQALGYSTTSVERASGQHAKNLLVIVEEASGVEDEIWDAIESLKYSKLVAIGNPIRGEGRFIELIRQADQDRADQSPQQQAVCAIQVPSTDSPHDNLGKSPYGLAGRAWLDACYRCYGRDSLWVRCHIRAELPDLSSDQLISESWLDCAPAV